MFCFYIDFTKLWVADEEQNQKINILLFTIYCLKEMQTKKRLYQLQQHSCENYSTRTNTPKAMKRTFISIKIMRYFALSFYPLWVHHMQLCLDDKWRLHMKVFDMHRNVFRYKICVQYKTNHVRWYYAWIGLFGHFNILAFEQGRVTLLLMSQENSCKLKFSIPNIWYS